MPRHPTSRPRQTNPVESAPEEQPANRLSGRALSICLSVPGLPISLRGGLAQLLPCDGFVALVDTTTSSMFVSARASDTRPYAWKGDPVPAGHPLRVAPVTEKGVTGWPYPTASTGSSIVRGGGGRSRLRGLRGERPVERGEVALLPRGTARPWVSRHHQLPDVWLSGNTRWWPASFFSDINGVNTKCWMFVMRSHSGPVRLGPSAGHSERRTSATERRPPPAPE